MTISGIGGSMDPYMGSMSGMRGRPNPSEGFNKADTDSSGGIDQTEFSDMVLKLSQLTGEEMDAEEAFTTYDEDEDGVLSEEEAVSVLEDNRPEGPPPGGSMGGMRPMQGGVDPSQLFRDADEDEHGSLDETESESLVELINNATGQEMTVEDLMAAYDEDEDGSLDEEESASALEDNRLEKASSAHMAGIENYRKMSSMAMGPEGPNAMHGMQGVTAGPSGSFNSVDARI